jgi:putative membrane protein
VAILFLAGPVKSLVVDYRWIMYSLFIGLTLGGIPIVWHLIGKPSRSMCMGVLCGFIGMAVLAWVQQRRLGTGGAAGAAPAMLFLAGAAGASAMILPGVSGGYLLLVLGQYIPILAAIDRFKEALSAGETADAVSVALRVGIPVGLGVVIGVVGVSNLLRVCLDRFRAATLGVLLGLLLGAVAGLWPFQRGVPPEIGDVIKGQTITAETINGIEPDDYPSEFFRPRLRHVGGSLVLIVVGFGVTFAVSRVGGREE